MSRSISEALPDDALQRHLGSLGIVRAQPDAEAIPEIELGKVAMQMLLSAVLTPRVPRLKMLNVPSMVLV